MFSVDTYNYLKEQVYKYSGGDYFQLVVKYEKKVKPGVYDTYWKKDWVMPGTLGVTEDDEILTRFDKPVPMHIGDKVSIYLEDQDYSLFVKLLNAPLFGLLNDQTDLKIKSLRTIVIGSNAKSIVKGYDAKAEIEEKQDDGWVNGIGQVMTVKVITETNPIGKYYASAGSTIDTITFPPAPQTSGTITVSGTNYDWGVKYDENGTETDMKYNPTTNALGRNYIFNTGEFYRQVIEYYPVPAGRNLSECEKVIVFTQK